MSFFSDRLTSIPPQEVAAALAGPGYFAVERALDPAAADAIMADVDDLQVQLNRNAPPNVHFKGAIYATHVFARSLTAFQIATHDWVTGVLRAALGEAFIMTGKRAYETRSGSYMCFHSDIAKPETEPDRVDSVVFIFYLNDVEQGEWEILEGSHRWGETAPPSRENDQALLGRADAVVHGFRMPKGSLVIYNGRLLHRASPYVSDSFARRSLFFQVNRGLKKGEPMLIETGFIRPDLSDDARMLLGFGRTPRMPPFPDSVATHLPGAERKRLLQAEDG